MSPNSYATGWLRKARYVWNSARSPENFGSRVLQTAATNLLLAGLAVITGTIAARLLGPTGRGELAAIQLWPTFLTSLAVLGLPEAIIYFGANNPRASGHYLGSALMLEMISAAGFAAAAYFFLPLLLAGHSESVASTARIYVLVIPLFAIANTPLYLLRAKQAFLPWNAMRLLQHLGWLTVLLVAWAAARADPSFVAVGYMVMLIVFTVVVYGVVWRRGRDRWLPRRIDLQPMLRYGIPTAASSIPQILNYRLDQLVLATFFPARTLGLYVVAVAWSSAVQPILIAAGTVLFPRVASATTGQARSHAFTEGARLGVALASSLVGFFLILTPISVPLLFGAEFGESVPAAIVLVAAGAILGLNHVLEEGLRGMGRPKLVMWAELWGLLATGGSLLILLPWFGLMGAAFGSLVGNALVSFLLFRWASHELEISVKELAAPDFKMAWKAFKADLKGTTDPTEPIELHGPQA